MARCGAPPAGHGAPGGAGVDRHACTRVFGQGSLAPDAAGALRAVMAGAVVFERAARRWNGGRANCPHCDLADEDAEHRFWQRPCWDE
eukprot:4106422-Lingulodinium_polyedra.AAC.1